MRYFVPMIKHREFIVKFIAIVTLLSVAISFIIVQKYTAVATILPPNTNQDAMFGLIGANIYGNVGGLGRLTSVVSGMPTVSDLYAAIMQSSRIKGEIIRRFDLKKVFRSKTMTDVGRELDRITSISVTGEGLVIVTVTYKNKKLAADIANAFIEELDKFNKESAMTVGKKYRLFIEQRLKEESDSLVISEERLKEFQEKNRTIVLDQEVSAAIKSIAEIKSQIMLREVQKGVIEQYSNNENPYYSNIDRELAELKRQLNSMEFGATGTISQGFGAGYSMPFSRLPKLTLDYARLVRDVRVQSAIYELLTQQFEQAKIMEVKDTPTVQFLDHAAPPEKRSSPNRRGIVVFCFICSILIGITLSYLIEYYSRIKNTPEWERISSPIRDDVAKFQKLILKIFRKK